MPHERSSGPSARRSRPLDPSTLQALAIRYVGRYATTQAKLTSYLNRKISERGWIEDNLPPVTDIVERCVAAGYVDDRAFAETKVRSLGGRGYGPRRVAAALQQSGIARDLAEAVLPDAESAFQNAETFARKRRIGVFGAAAADRDLARRQFAAMIRAGHSVELAGYFVRGVPDANSDDGN